MTQIFFPYPSWTYQVSNLHFALSDPTGHLRKLVVDTQTHTLVRTLYPTDINGYPWSPRKILCKPKHHQALPTLHFLPFRFLRLPCQQQYTHSKWATIVMALFLHQLTIYQYYQPEMMTQIFFPYPSWTYQVLKMDNLHFLTQLATLESWLKTPKPIPW